MVWCYAFLGKTFLFHDISEMAHIIYELIIALSSLGVQTIVCVNGV